MSKIFLMVVILSLANLCFAKGPDGWETIKGGGYAKISAGAKPETELQPEPSTFAPPFPKARICEGMFLDGVHHSSSRGLSALIPQLRAQGISVAPISNYNVVALGIPADFQFSSEIPRNGKAKLLPIVGVNIEIPGASIQSTVHGEQFVIARAFTLGIPLRTIVVNGAPCGHCRQFIYELSPQTRVATDPNKPVKSISEILPDAFGPHDLGVQANMIDVSSEASNKRARIAQIFAEWEATSLSGKIPSGVELVNLGAYGPAKNRSCKILKT